MLYSIQEKKIIEEEKAIIYEGGRYLRDEVIFELYFEILDCLRKQVLGEIYFKFYRKRC